MKRVLSIQDISCIGKCSLTVALPVLSAAGLECAILPTAVLSTHTAFQGFTFRDLSDDIQKISAHWQQQKIAFDGIYTGYLGNLRQIELAEEFFRDFNRPGLLKFVDPAMGDNGRLYVGFTPDFALRMGKLCAGADVIVPNLTEAAFMLGEPVLPEDAAEEDLHALLRRLTKLGAENIVLTGVSPSPDLCGIVTFTPSSNRFSSYFSKKLPVSFHGTGDVFASAFFAAMMRGQSLEDASKTAVEFTVESMRCTLAHPDHNWYGVDFENAIPELLRLLKLV